MLRILIVLLVVIPGIEIWLLIQVGHWIGGWQTLGLILLTGFAGAWFVRKEARLVWHRARYELESGNIPGRHILDGICLLVGGLMLLTPGFVTDAVGMLLVFPFTRSLVRAWMLYGLEKAAERGRLNFLQFRKW